MFHGSLPAKAQSIIGEIVRAWDCQDIFVPCSGNFTVERMLWALGKQSLYSNDVTLYSTAIGTYFAGKDLDIHLKPEYEEEYGWVWQHSSIMEEKLANIMLISAFIPAIGKSNPYYERQREAYRDQWDVLHEKMIKKISNVPVRVKDYFAADAMEVIRDMPDTAGVITFPPFSGAGKAFTRDFAKMEKLFDWEPPVFTEFNEDTLVEFFERVTSREHWIIGTNQRLSELEESLYGITRTTNRGVPIYLYASGGKARICMPRQETEPVLNDKLRPGLEIGDSMSLSILSSAQFSALRSQYMNINIRPGTATAAIAVLVDGLLIGVYALSAAPTMAHWEGKIETPCIYLLSDFPIAPTDYKHLAKLVLYAALSKEGKLIAERISNRRVRSLITTAFTNKPVSMKYRGLFTLLSRKENDAFSTDWGKDISQGNTYYAQKYTLNYGAIMGQWTLDEGLAVWKKKSGGKI